MIFAPMMLPAESEPCFFAMAVSVVTSSGRDVPMAMMVTEMTRSETPHMEASAGAVIDKELCTGDRADRADEELDNIGDDGFFRDGLIELLTLCPALDGDDGLVDVVVHGNDENNDEQNAGNHADAVIKQ